MEIDGLAACLAAVYFKETQARKVKWGHMAPGDRSLWRLIARAAKEYLEDTKPR